MYKRVSYRNLTTFLSDVFPPRSSSLHYTSSKRLSSLKRSSLYCSLKCQPRFCSTSCINLSQKRFYTSRNILKLVERGMWQDRFPDNNLEFEKAIVNEPQCIYAGFDPTADSLHVGNLLILIALMHCQRAGHKPIVLLGGFTSTIGDPSGRTVSRPELKKDKASCNLSKMRDSVLNIFENHKNLFWPHQEEHPLPELKIVNNEEWYGNMTAHGVLSLAANIPVKELFNTSFVRARLESKDSFMLKELLYPVFQAYDWLYLYDKYKCKVQIGGNDQSGNIFKGHDLIRDLRKDCATGLTVPLLTTSNGEKYGKSAGNAVWLCPSKTPYVHFYQYFLRTTDNDVEKLLKLFTFYPMKQIDEIMERHESDTGAQYAQKMLARAVTKLVHGEDGLRVAIKSTQVLFERNALALLDLQANELEQLFSGVYTELTLTPAMTVLELAMAANCFRSEAEADHIIRAGGLHINQCKVQDPIVVLTPEAHILPQGYSLLGVGKRKYTLIKWTT